MTTDQIIKYSISCLNTVIFSEIETQLYLEFPDLKYKNKYFLANGNIINKFASLKENRIKNGTIILIDVNE